MNKKIENTFQKKHYRILLVDDHLGYLTSAGYLQYRLKETLNKYYNNFEINRGRNRESFKNKYGEFEIKVTIYPENRLKNMEFRLKTEPFDLILLDLNFKEEINCQKYLKCDKSDFEADTPLESVRCFYCKEILESLLKKKLKKKPSDFYNELGAYWLRFKIRPFNPAIPVIIFTSKFENSIEMASKYGINEYNADYFEKIKLLKRDDDIDTDRGFYILVDKILEGIRRYEQSFKDKIEISDTREETELEARNRDYMQTRLWNVFTESLHRERNRLVPFKASLSVDSDDNNKFAVVFIDFDGMKSANDRLGYSNTNVVIKNFTKLLSEFIENHWKSLVKNEFRWLPFYKPVHGRYFRERGDEFIIIFPSISDKQTSKDDVRKGVHHFLDELWSKINSPEWQNELFKIKIQERLLCCKDDVRDKIMPVLNGKVDILSEEDERYIIMSGVLSEEDFKSLRSSGLKGKCLAEIESHLINYRNLTISSPLTSSMGLFVFPDDLTIKNLKKLKDTNTSVLGNQHKAINDITEIYSEITRISQDLKDKAKLLGKNQYCYFQQTCLIYNKSGVFVNPRVNVGIILPSHDGDREEVKRHKGDMIELLRYITDDVAFDFELVTIEEIEHLIDYCINYHLLLYVFNGDVSAKKDIETIRKNDRVKQKKCGFIIWFKDDKVDQSYVDGFRTDHVLSTISGYRKFFPDDKLILSKYNREKHSDMIANINFLRDARKAFFETVSALAREHNIDRYYPRFQIQESIFNKFESLKKDVCIIETKHDVNKFDKNNKDDIGALVNFYDGLANKSPEDIWILKRISNKGGKSTCNIIVTIAVNTAAFDFLNMASGRNMVKLQQYYNGFFKGFMAGDPDGEYLKNLSIWKYEVTSSQYDKYKKGNSGDIVCRSPFFSPVSPNVYYEIVTPSRVRIDISFQKEGVK